MFSLMSSLTKDTRTVFIGAGLWSFHLPSCRIDSRNLTTNANSPDNPHFHPGLNLTKPLKMDIRLSNVMLLFSDPYSVRIGFGITNTVFRTHLHHLDPERLKASLQCLVNLCGTSSAGGSDEDWQPGLGVKAYKAPG